MKKGLIKILAGTVIIGTLGLTNCETMRQKGFPEKMISGVEYPIMTQDRIPYQLEEQVLYEDREYFYGKEQTEETLPMVILRYDDVTRELDLDSGNIELQSKKKYIPRKVEAVKYTKDKWVDGVVLRIDGPYGMKAYMMPLDEIKRMNNISGKKYGYKVVISEDGASFAFRTMKILGEEYFFPYVEDSKAKENGKLPYYLIPVKGAKIRIENKCGNLSIYNENKVYQPIDPEIFPELFKKEDNKVQIQNTTSN
jgi:hypothetical protein